VRIGVIGQGYVGLTASVCLAEAGHQVTGVERDPLRLRLLEDGTAPFYEPGLQDLLTRMVASGGLAFRSSAKDLPTELDAVLVAVGSPQLPSGGTDLRDLTSAIEEILRLRPLPGLIAVKSTVPPGTSRQLLSDIRPDLTRRYVYSPEFLSQGAAVEGWKGPSRVVAGVEDEAPLASLRDMYRGIQAPWIVTTTTDAEMIKYASNAFLATKISFINEIANLCDEVGASIDDVVNGLALDPRVGSHFLRAGIGYGGSCFPKDVQALTHLSSLRGRPMPLLQSVVAVNQAQRLRLVRAVRDNVDPGATVGILGLAFKPGTDDTREAPSLTVIPELLAAGYRIRAWDPAAPPDLERQALPGIGRRSSILEAAKGAGAVVVLTEWPDIIEADWQVIAGAMVEPWMVLDARNCLEPQKLVAAGLRYWGIGRGLRDRVPQPGTLVRRNER
jgi:UDPglucose 6-dehydrogenase